MATMTVEVLEGSDLVDREIDVPDEVINAASDAAECENRVMVIGLHPYFGWIYCDKEDEGRKAEMAYNFPCDAWGLAQ